MRRRAPPRGSRRGHHVEDPSAGGHDLPVVVPGRAGVEDVDVVTVSADSSRRWGRRSGGRPGYPRRDDDVDRVGPVDAEVVDLLEAAGGGGVEEAAERGAELGEGDLAVGVAEARVELDDARAAGGQGQADEEDPHERGAPVAHLVDRGLGDPVDHRSARSAGAQSSGEYAPMPPVLGPSSLSTTRLKSWAGGRARTVVPSVTQKTETSGPSRNSSMTTRPPGLAKQAAAWVRASSRLFGDDHALAGGEPVVLDDVWRAEVVECVVDLLGRGADVGARRGDVGRGHDLLGERLAALQLGGGG